MGVTGSGGSGRAVDPFGQQTYDQHRGLIPDDFCEVGERDDGHVQTYEHPRWYFAPVDEWDAHLQKALDYVRGRTLDIGCGAGRVALPLQQRGVDVVGIDSSPLAVRTCRERGVRDVRLLSVTQVSVKRLGTFDSVLMLGNNFGLFGNRDRARRLLRRLHGMTSAQGRIVAETTDPYATSNPVHLAYQERNRSRGRMGGQYRHRDCYGNLKGPWHDWLFVSRDEMQDIVAGTGWVVRRFVEPEGAQYAAVMEKE